MRISPSFSLIKFTVNEKIEVELSSKTKKYSDELPAINELQIINSFALARISLKLSIFEIMRFFKCILPVQPLQLKS